MLRDESWWRSIGVAAVLCLAAAACGGGGGHGGATGAACPEIFALGFRNPWRMNFDPENGRLYVGDVGQNAREEIDLVTLGGNYGWDCVEGDLPHATNAPCNGTFVPPEVVHDRNDAQAIVGGAVYRGSAIPSIDGFYIYGDFLTRKFFAFDTATEGSPAQRITQLNASVAAFGQDGAGEIYAVTFESPSIKKIGSGLGGSGLGSLVFADAFPGRSFANPVKLVRHPTNSNRWYVVEQGGLVKTFLSTDSAAPTTAANVKQVVGNLGSGGEQGLLGMAFDTDFAATGEVYLTYTNEVTQSSVLARWVSHDNGMTFAPAAPAVVLAISHPFDNHNGGDLAFGRDGFLYYSMGDGGGADDPNDNGQNSAVLLGKILRLDVNTAPPAGEAYAIPPDNPNAGNAHCDAPQG